MSKSGKKRVPEPCSYASAPRQMRTGYVELLLQYVERFAGRNLSGYDAKLLLTIVKAVIADIQTDEQEDSSYVLP